MEILGVGPLELAFILIIALIVLGPQDMVKTGKTIGRFMRRIVKSPTWQAVQQTSRDLKYLPNRLMREAGMEEDMQELKKVGNDVKQIGDIKTSISGELDKTTKEINKDLSAWTTPPDEQVVTASPPAPAAKTEDHPKVEETPPSEDLPTTESENN